VPRVIVTAITIVVAAAAVFGASATPQITVIAFWSTTYYSSAKWAILDHVVTRGAPPLSGDVIDFGLWAIADEVAHIEANFEVNGSDHFPVTATIHVP